jgi:putative transcriptional regulator
MNDIKEIREKLGLSQAALAEKIGVSSCSVSRWERGVFSPSPLATRRLKHLLAAREESGMIWSSMIYHQYETATGDINMLRTVVKQGFRCPNCGEYTSSQDIYTNLLTCGCRYLIAGRGKERGKLIVFSPQE